MATVAELIRRKRDGGVLTPDEIRHLLDDYTAGALPDYQAAALLMAVFFRGLDGNELKAWTDAMLHSGDVLDLSGIPGGKVDKHSTGGVGDMISLPLAPLVAVCGGVVPMISGRGLGHTGGTLDKLEAIPGFRIDLDETRVRAQLGRIGVAMIGQTDRLAPADRKLYALRDVTGTVESIPLIASSIMSKKLAEGIDALVLDVKFGQGAFMKRDDSARQLALTLCAIGRAAGKRVTAFLTDMNQPLGRYVGNALEVREAIAQLKGEGSLDVKRLVLEQASEMLVLAGAAPDLAAAQQAITRAATSGEGLARFAQLVEAQGGDPSAILDGKLPTAPASEPITAPRGGVVVAIDAEAVGWAAVSLGAGRARKEDVIDPAVGFELLKKVGDPIEKGEPLALVHHRDGRGLEEATRRVLGAYRLGDMNDTMPASRPLILEILR